MRGTAEDEGGVMAKETPNAQIINPVPRISIQAFCESQEIASVVQAAITDRRVTSHLTSGVTLRSSRELTKARLFWFGCPVAATSPAAMP